MTQTLLSVEEAAQKLGGVSRWTVYAWLSKRRLRKTKVGSRVMIAEADLEAFLLACNPQSSELVSACSEQSDMSHRLGT